jgi:hypothetical protein
MGRHFGTSYHWTILIILLILLFDHFRNRLEAFWQTV